MLPRATKIITGIKTKLPRTAFYDKQGLHFLAEDSRFINYL